jgi:hypothetical protein
MMRLGRKCAAAILVLACTPAIACGGQGATTEPRDTSGTGMSSTAKSAVTSGCASSVAPPCAAATREGARGTGILSRTRFVKAPIIVYFKPRKPDPHFAGYTIYFRLTRDLPRNPSGGRNGKFAPFEGSSDPILGALAKPGRWCFGQDVSTDPTSSGLPTKAGAKIRLMLKASDHRHRTGTLAATATVLVQKPRAANDYRPYPYPKKLGCPVG